MDCDKAIYRVYGYLDGELTVWRRWTIRRHLDKCPPCAHRLIWRQCDQENPTRTPQCAQ
jgi:anti-sigma factor RsiW